MSDIIDINTLKTHLATISNARKDIILSSDTVEDKQIQLNLLDKENDELNQSIDIFFRLMEYTATTDIEKINELLLSLENGTIDIISKFAPQLYQDMSQHFSSNTGLSASALSSISPKFISSYEQLSIIFASVPNGGFLSVRFENDITPTFMNDRNFDIFFNLSQFTFYFSTFSNAFLGTSYYGSRSLVFSNGYLRFGSSSFPDEHYFTPIRSHLYPLSVAFSDVTVYLSSLSSFISSHSGKCLSVVFRNVTFKKDSNSDSFFPFLNSNSQIVNVSIYNLFLEDGLTLDDLFDNINNINFI